MIFLATSVALAHLLSEKRRPKSEFWDQPIIASRLLEYELWARLNKLELQRVQDAEARSLIGRIALIEMIPEIVARARDRFPSDVRSLEALHLASASFLIRQGVELQLASYDRRMREGARRLDITLYQL